jgi:spermidine synthase
MSLTGGTADPVSIRTQYQRLDVIRLQGFGLCMILDGRIQLAESDEWIYHELLVHPACVLHGDPRRVLVLGGGDGCATRELLRYPHLDENVVVDIDEAVVELFRNRFSSINGGALNDPRVRVLCSDASEFLDGWRGDFDLIISDLTEPFDPTDPGEVLSAHLYTPLSYELIKSRLAAGGIFVCQTAGIIAQPQHDRFHMRILPEIQRHFRHVKTCYEFIPSFGEMWSITLASPRPLRIAGPQVDRALRRHRVTGLRYYDGIAHERAFRAPLFLRNPHPEDG